MENKECPIGGEICTGGKCYLAEQVKDEAIKGGVSADSFRGGANWEEDVWKDYMNRTEIFAKKYSCPQKEKLIGTIIPEVTQKKHENKEFY